MVRFSFFILCISLFCVVTSKPLSDDDIMQTTCLIKHPAKIAIVYQRSPRRSDVNINIKLIYNNSVSVQANIQVIHNNNISDSQLVYSQNTISNRKLESYQHC